MPAIDANARNFLFTTDYPLDKIIYMSTGSVTVGSMSSGSSTVAHGLPFTPLLDGTWSTDSTFALSYDIGSGTASTSSGILFNVGTELYATSTNAVFTVNNNTGSSVTVYYRLFGFEPSNSNLDAPYTSSVADDFVLNTDYNYTKLYEANRITGASTVTHGFGYRPQVVLWEELTASGRIYRNNQSPVYNPSASKAEIGTSSIVFTVDTGSAVHYRVYLDS